MGVQINDYMHFVFMACLGKPRGNSLYPLEAMSHIFRALYAEQRPVGNFIAFLFYAPFYGKVGARRSSTVLAAKLGGSGAGSVHI